MLRHREEWCEVLTASACLSLAVFIGLIAFHGYSEMKKYGICRNHFVRRFHLKSSSNLVVEEVNKDINNNDPSDKRECKSVTYVELRESLLDN